MPTIDFTGGAYRDSTRGATLKALAARRAAMEEATIRASQPSQQPIVNPWQGIGQVANVISAGIREGRAANAETASRQRFAELMAGGLTQDEMGEAMMIDPETAGVYQQHAWDTEKQAADRAEAQRIAEQGHTWDVEAASTLAQVNKEAADARAAVDAAQKEADYKHDDESARNLEASQIRLKEAEARLAEIADKGKQAREIDTKRQEAGILKPTEEWGPVTPEIATQYGGDVAKNPSNYHMNKAGDIELINPSQFSPAEQEKRTSDTKSKLSTIDVGLDALGRALELAPDVTELGAVGRTLYGPSGMIPEGMQPDQYKRTAEATKRFDQIMKSNAIQQMAVQLSGTDSDKDVQRFIEIMADPNSTLTLKKQTLANMINRLKQERITQAERLKGITGEDTPEYKYTNQDVLSGDAAPATAAPAADPLTQARDAIAKGADRAAVIKRLQENGIDPTGL